MDTLPVRSTQSQKLRESVNKYYNFRSNEYFHLLLLIIFIHSQGEIKRNDATRTAKRAHRKDEKIAREKNTRSDTRENQLRSRRVAKKNRTTNQKTKVYRRIESQLNRLNFTILFFNYSRLEQKQREEEYERELAEKHSKIDHRKLQVEQLEEVNEKYLFSCV